VKRKCDDNVNLVVTDASARYFNMIGYELAGIVPYVTTDASESFVVKVTLKSVLKVFFNNHQTKKSGTRPLS